MIRTAWLLAAAFGVVQQNAFAQQQPQAAAPDDFRSSRSDQISRRRLHAGRARVKHHRRCGERRDHHGGRRVRGVYDRSRPRSARFRNLPIKYLIDTISHGDHSGATAPFAKGTGSCRRRGQCQEEVAHWTTNGLTRRENAACGRRTRFRPRPTPALSSSVSGSVADLKHAPNANRTVTPMSGSRPPTCCRPAGYLHNAVTPISTSPMAAAIRA